MKSVDSASSKVCLLLSESETTNFQISTCYQESSYRIGGLMDINKVSDQPKKQIRRRLHTSKPYQESFVNMAEARREIATALKFHRASMKAAANHDHRPELEKKPVYPDMVTTNYWPLVPPPPPSLSQEYYNLEQLPNQPLGLNLNFKDFNNLNTSIYYNPMPASSAQSAAKKSLETSEIGTVEDVTKSVDWCYEPFEQVMEFPPWLINANETSCSQHIFDHQLSLDPALPCMDIDDIEVMDGEEWLA
ncbi:hypothetical protein HanPI659440_Chr06g0237811 [Helianthus annuus]|nr:hypothetical protein HanPI659440_Chr06g0237811 [Helianthus annuus]